MRNTSKVSLKGTGMQLVLTAPRRTLSRSRLTERMMMPLTEQQVLDELKKHGVTSLDKLAEKVAEQSAARAEFDRVREVDEADYVWSGKNYSLYHPE